jgi:hypothetical protein
VAHKYLALAVLALAAVAALVGCDSATGTVSGGEALVAQPDSGPGTTWTSLYDDFFGPSGQASCASQGVCHGSASEPGAQTSGFVCGASKDECWAGMTQGINPDAGGIFCPIVCLGTCPQDTQPCAITDPTKQPLYQDIHKSTSGGLNNMPCGGNLQTCLAASAAYTFTADDLARITTWIQQGAQDN